MPKARCHTRSVAAAQDSPLLKLPAELRNMIYDLIVRDETSLSVRKDGTLYSPPLSLVCRQIRSEYELIYLNEAPKYAQRLNIHLTNFFFEDTVNAVESVIAESPGTNHTFSIRVFVTNMWKPYQVRQLCKHSEFTSYVPAWQYRPLGTTTHPHDVQIRFDPKSFDAEFCKQQVERLDWCIGRTRMYGTWRPVKNAFLEAFQKYKPKSSQKIRKRRKASRKNGGPVRKRRA